MSYCRWSSDDWRSDVYCYEHVDGGFYIHVASRRIVGDVPHLPSLLEVGVEVWHAAWRAQLDFIDMAERERIGLPHDGETLVEATAARCADRLLELRKLGYHVPDYAIEALREEA